MTISKWLKRMDVFLGLSDKKFHNIQQCTTKNCEYGTENFCDGRINGTAKRKNPEIKAPCPFYINGKCSKELHTGKCKREFDDI